MEPYVRKKMPQGVVSSVALTCWTEIITCQTSARCARLYSFEVPKVKTKVWLVYAEALQLSLDQHLCSWTRVAHHDKFSPPMRILYTDVCFLFNTEEETFSSERERETLIVWYWDCICKCACLFQCTHTHTHPFICAHTHFLSLFSPCSPPLPLSADKRVFPVQATEKALMLPPKRWHAQRNF